jgi:hypothetical protein
MFVYIFCNHERIKIRCNEKIALLTIKFYIILMSFCFDQTYQFGYKTNWNPKISICFSKVTISKM